MNDAVARRIARFGSGWIPWGSAFADLPTAIKTMKDKVLAHGGDPSDLQVQGAARAVKGDDGSIDYTASAASVPALVAAGVTDVRFTVAVPADGDRAVEVLSSLVEAFRDVTRELPASPNRAEVKRSCMQLRDHDGSQVLFHPLGIRRAGRIAWCEPSNWVRFVQFDQQSRAASDFASASHAEGRWFDPSRDHKVQCYLRWRAQYLHNTSRTSVTPVMPHAPTSRPKAPG